MCYVYFSTLIAMRFKLYSQHFCVKHVLSSASIKLCQHYFILCIVYTVHSVFILLCLQLFMQDGYRNNSWEIRHKCTCISLI